MAASKPLRPAEDGAPPIFSLCVAGVVALGLDGAGAYAPDAGEVCGGGETGCWSATVFAPRIPNM